MSEQAMSEAAMLVSLRDIQLPAEAAGGIAADLAAAAGLAGVVALLIASILRVLSLRRRAAESNKTARMLAITEMPEKARRVALLHLLKDADRTRYAQVKGALYQPKGGVDLATLEAEVARLV